MNPECERRKRLRSLWILFIGWRGLSESFSTPRLWCGVDLLREPQCRDQPAMAIVSIMDHKRFPGDVRDEWFHRMLHGWLALSLIFAYKILPIPCGAYAHLGPRKTTGKLPLRIPCIVSLMERILCLIKVDLILKNNTILPSLSSRNIFIQPESRGIVGVPVAFWSQPETAIAE